MKKLLLAASIVLAGSSLSTAFTPAITAEAKAFTKAEVNAIKKGTFLHAKGKIGVDS